MKPIIEVQNLSKLYQIGAKEAYGSLRDEIMQVLRTMLTLYSSLSIGLIYAGYDHQI